MAQYCLSILSDIHYAGAAEKNRAVNGYRTVPNPMHRWIIKCWEHFVWEREPLAYNHLLDEFLEAPLPAPDLVIANGDYTSDTAGVGVSDDAACQSAVECLQKLRAKFEGRFCATIGDHELGKFSMGGHRGGLRVASYHRSLNELHLQPFWQLNLGHYVLMGVTSPLVALPVYLPETLVEERPEWEQLRAAHLADIQKAFTRLKSHQRVILFCHDPTALPFLGRDERVRSKLSQVEQTIIGHLHSEWILRPTRWLAGMPTVRFLGPTPRRVTTALGQARHWRPFRVRLCPALRGIDLMKDGGYYTVELDLEGRTPAKFHRHRLRQEGTKVRDKARKLS
jgi:hypothetical protein